MSKFVWYTVSICLIAIMINVAVYGQIRSGAGFLQIQPGARETALRAASVSGLDVLHAIYDNPAAIGFTREWQWAGTYSTWIADTYTSSLLASHRINNHWLPKLRGALGVHYLGIPKFNSTADVAEPVSGADMRITAGIGIPLRIGAHALAFGFNASYFRSQLANFVARTAVFDAGLLFRTRRFNIGLHNPSLVDYLILSAGISITNIGQPLIFVSEGTPLPRTMHTGFGLYAGSHHGFQWHFSAGYRFARDADAIPEISTEFSWSQLLAFQFGYQFGDELLGNASFGGSIILSDRTLRQFFGRGHTLRLDIAGNETNAFFNTPYYGTVAAYTNAPEYFSLKAPANNSVLHENTITLQWDPVDDPDLYDTIHYYLIIARDSSAVSRVFQYVRRRHQLPESSDVDFIIIDLWKPMFRAPEMHAGRYFWTVIAMDLDTHFRIASQQGRHINSFVITSPQPKIRNLRFDYHPWITQDDFQGVISFEVINQGNRPAYQLVVSVDDKLPSLEKIMTCFTATIDTLLPDSSKTFSFKWKTAVHGNHRLSARVRWPYMTRLEADSCAIICSTIPKGKFVTYDSVTVLKLNAITFEIPYVGKIFFPAGSKNIPAIYDSNWVTEPPLKTFARRLRMNPRIRISLKGTADPNSGEMNVALANDRARAVADRLIQLGVPDKQIIIQPGVLLPRRRVPVDSLDARWIFEERRRVDMSVDEKFEEGIFSPLESTYYQQFESPVPFLSSIRWSTPIQSGLLLWANDSLVDSTSILQWFDQYGMQDSIYWQPPYERNFLENYWVRHFFRYSIQVTDSLHRTFRTREKYCLAQKEILQLERSYYVIARFGQARPLYSFYWQNLLERLPMLLHDKSKRIRFIGHGCAIGAESINKWLSQKRAQTFQAIFLNDVQQKYPKLYEEIIKRMDDAEGKGETEPIQFTTSDGSTVILGDNNVPLGRVLNRRVMVLFYTVAKNRFK